jgi:hypothetical protein
VGWAMDRVAFEDLEAPIGYSPDMDEEEVLMISYVNMQIIISYLNNNFLCE